MLRFLYEEFKSHDCVSYFPQYNWVVKNRIGQGNEPKKTAGLKLIVPNVEALSVAKKTQPKELVLIGSFPDLGELKVRWIGEDPKSMKMTAGALRLPGHSSNTGEIAFSLLEGYLDNILFPPERDESLAACYDDLDRRRRSDYDGKRVDLEQRCIAGCEAQFRLIIARLVHVYGGGQIDSTFYEEWGKKNKFWRRLYSGTIN